jgi:hypothetical protein
LLHGVGGGVRDVHHHAELATGADHVGAEGCQSVVDDGAGLEVAEVVRRVVDELHRADTARVGLLQPLELLLEEVEPLDVDNDGRLAGGVGGLDVRYGEGAADAVLGHQLVRPGEPIEMVRPELPGRWHARGDGHVLSVAAEDGRVRDVGEAEHRDPARAHAPRDLIAGAGGARRDAVGPGVRMDVHRDVVAQQRVGRGERLG